MPSIFLCHNRRDKRFTRRLAKRLTQEDVVVWVDEAEIKIGDSLIEKISEGIHEMDYVGAILSPNSVASNWVQKELSLAMSKEIAGRRVVVLPILIADCEFPTFLKDKLYADFRDPEQFDRQVNRLLRAMGFRYEMSIDWTDEGPRVSGNLVIISPSEANSLLERWLEHIPKFVYKERHRRGDDSPDVMGAANVLAVLRACYDVYNRAPTADEIEEGISELARKYELFYQFTMEMHAETLRGLMNSEPD